LDLTENFFKRYGDKAIFISRFIPVVRHLISIPAGIGQMKLSKFIIYTTVGAAIWNSILAYIGFVLGSNWESIRKYTEVIDIVVVVAIVGAIILFFLRLRKKTRAY
jgi:membrane protein DedA with SNARE-associated domain